MKSVVILHICIMTFSMFTWYDLEIPSLNRSSIDHKRINSWITDIHLPYFQPKLSCCRVISNKKITVWHNNYFIVCPMTKFQGSQSKFFSSWLVNHLCSFSSWDTNGVYLQNNTFDFNSWRIMKKKKKKLICQRSEHMYLSGCSVCWRVMGQYRWRCNELMLRTIGETLGDIAKSQASALWGHHFGSLWMIFFRLLFRLKVLRSIV